MFPIPSEFCNSERQKLSSQTLCKLKGARQEAWLYPPPGGVSFGDAPSEDLPDHTCRLPDHRKTPGIHRFLTWVNPIRCC